MEINKDSIKPLPQKIVETLSTIIAPGGVIHLSPYIEDTQFSRLFGTQPAKKNRFSSSQKILEDNKLKLKESAEEWKEFEKKGKRFQKGIYNETFLQAYLAYYFPVNLAKIQILLTELAGSGNLPQELNLLDIGVGSGTTALALVDWLLLLNEVCDFHNYPFPFTRISYTGVDANQNCLEYAESTLTKYKEITKECKSTHQEIIFSGLENSKFEKIDLDTAKNYLPVDNTNFLVISYTWNELSQQARENCESIFRSLSEDAIITILERADEKSSSGLMKWRRNFLKENQAFSNLGPCGNEFCRELPKNCDSCWIYRKEEFVKSTLYEEFRKEINTNQKGKKEKDRDEILKWSYVILKKGNVPQKDDKSLPSAKDLPNENKDGINQKYYLRFMGNYQMSGKKYIKLCPQNHPAGKIELEEKIGKQVPKVPYGKHFSIENFRIKKENNKLIILPTKYTEYTYKNPEKECDDFLSSYGEKQKGAVNAFGYRYFGFEKMKPFQHKIFKKILTGKSILAIAATGSGKSESFILASLLFPGVTVVVSPLKSLMTDQYEYRIKKRYGLHSLATFINGDVLFKERERRLDKLRKGYYKLVYFTPEQLERGHILGILEKTNKNKNIGIRYLVFDEAHCINHWGHDFRPAYANIVKRLKKYEIEPVKIGLTATAMEYTRKDICKELKIKESPIEEGGNLFVDSSDRPELNWVVKHCDEKAKDILANLKKLLSGNDKNSDKGNAIVFMPHTGGNPEGWNWEKTDESWGLSPTVNLFASWLEKKLGQRVCIYHSKMEHDEPEEETEEKGLKVKWFPGNMKGRKREREQENFMKGKYPIMVATKGFGMGIDKSNIRLIIHRTLPINLEAYIQEAGRAGRDGESANCILYYSPDKPKVNGKEKQSDKEIQKYFVKKEKIEEGGAELIYEFLLQLSKENPERKIKEDNLYFTNDEVMEFFDKREDFPWPEFEQREKGLWGEEFGKHTEILDKGHKYKEKTDYIDLLLSRLYATQIEDLSFFEFCQETGAKIKLRKSQTIKIKDIKSIFDSDYYFEKVLRDKNIDEEEFLNFLKQGEKEDILPFCKIMNFSVTEAAGFLRDIKSADLLDFFIGAPKYGPASGKDDYSEWLDYAGAWRRARGKRNATNEDYFPWNFLNKPKGWEVKLGSVFENGGNWESYFDKFKKNSKKIYENREKSFNEFLREYVGVKEDGLMITKRRGCLRTIILGYLKSPEVVIKESCHSCSLCVPDLQFGTIKEKKEAVGKLLPGTKEFLERMERDYWDTFPLGADIEKFFEIETNEEKEGHRFKEYAKWRIERVSHDKEKYIFGSFIRSVQIVRDEDSNQKTLSNFLEELWDEATDTEEDLIWNYIAKPLWDKESESKILNFSFYWKVSVESANIIKNKEQSWKKL